MTVVYDPELEVDHRIYYDAKIGRGIRIEVRDPETDEVVSTEEIPAEGTLVELRKRARQEAGRKAEELGGKVFVGFDPGILTKEIRTYMEAV